MQKSNRLKGAIHIHSNYRPAEKVRGVNGQIEEAKKLDFLMYL
jgi:hypothetical protein